MAPICYNFDENLSADAILCTNVMDSTFRAAFSSLSSCLIAYKVYSCLCSPIVQFLVFVMFFIRLVSILRITKYQRNHQLADNYSNGKCTSQL